MNSALHWDSNHFDEEQLYRPSSVCPVLPNRDAVDTEAIDYYREHGYLAVDGLLQPNEVAEALERINVLVNSNADDQPGAQRETGASASEDNIPDIDRMRRVCFAQGRLDYEIIPIDHPSIMAVVSRLLSGRVDPDPNRPDRPRLFQQMALIKPPKIGGEKPWHQDHAYFKFAIDTRIVGVWIALDEATMTNGCMHLIDRGHREGPIPHFKRRDWQICDTEIINRRVTACELKPGGVLFFDGKLPHGTPTNRSGLRRRAMQFHYLPENAIPTNDAARLAVWGEDGKDVTC